MSSSFCRLINLPQSRYAGHTEVSRLQFANADNFKGVATTNAVIAMGDVKTLKSHTFKGNYRKSDDV